MDLLVSVSSDLFLVVLQFVSELLVLVKKILRTCLVLVQTSSTKKPRDVVVVELNHELPPRSCAFIIAWTCSSVKSLRAASAFSFALYSNPTISKPGNSNSKISLLFSWAIFSIPTPCWCAFIDSFLEAFCDCSSLCSWWLSSAIALTFNNIKASKINFIYFLQQIISGGIYYVWRWCFNCNSEWDRAPENWNEDSEWENISSPIVSCSGWNNKHSF